MNYDPFLLESYKVALNSPDPSTQNGALLLRKSEYGINGFRVVASGFNAFPKGINAEYWHGQKEDKYARVVHAETGVLLRAAKYGESTVGTTMVCAWAACSNCAKHIAYAGVSTLVRHTYANNGADTGSHWFQDCLVGDEIMREAGVEIIEVPPVATKIQLRRNGALWPAVLETA